uniref:MULE transposase domain-containing protein n=1 Tax=Lactuca sativa TaxID=4236 RepID=A0A9R1X334_LACSA|nr:hypothetical protein LSAT_V11C700355580 [Lactuca sativa]
MWHCFFIIFENGHPTLFTIKLYHGGEFTKYPDVRYIDGTVNYVDMVDIDEFSVHELVAIMKGFRYGVPPVIYYHFLVPGGDFHFGLRPLGNDENHKVMKVYTEHGETRLLTYFLNPKPVTKVTLVQLDEPHEDVQHNDEAPDDQSKETHVMTTPTDAVPTQPNQHEIQVNEVLQFVSLSPEYNRRRVMSKDGVMASCSKKIYFDGIGETEQIAKDFVEATIDFDIGLYQQILQSNVDGVNGLDMHDVNEPQMDEENQPQMNEFWDFDYQTDACVQDGSENQPQSNMDKGSETDQEDDSDDNDYWVDEDNVIEDVEVDMRDFNMSIDTEVEFLDKRTRNPRQHESDEEANELDVIDNDVFDSMDEDSDQDRKTRAVLKQLSKEKSCSLDEVHKCHFKIGKKCNSKQELKEKVKMHALETKKNIAFKKNDKCILKAICNGLVDLPNLRKVKRKVKKKDKQGGSSEDKADFSCPLMLHASRSTDASSWYIKTYEDKHTCMNTRKVRAATAKFMSKQIMYQVECNPTIPIKSLQEQLQKKYGVDAKKIVVGDYKKQYEVLRDYILELQLTNPDTTVNLELGDISESNMNLCLSRGMKNGFNACLRDFLGLDGAHMKGPYPGQILTAIGLDSNNGIYPLAYVIVEIENYESWKWFLECLGDDLDLHAMSNFTFVSDRQKGLLQAVRQLFPCAEHRLCLRHIHENMKKQWRTKEYKDHLWDCTTATTVPEFNHYMHQLSLYDNSAYEWLKSIPPQHWAKSHFTGSSRQKQTVTYLPGQDIPKIGALGCYLSMMSELSPTFYRSTSPLSMEKMKSLRGAIDGEDEITDGVIVRACCWR